MNKIRHHIALTLIVLMAGQHAFCQIYSNNADAVKEITYKTYVGDDKLFVFYQSNETYKPGSLSADGPVTGDFDFRWTKYDPVSSSFTIEIKTETGVASSTVENLSDGGYRVQITNGLDVDTSWIAWVMLDNLKVWNLKDSNGNIPKYQSNCAEANQLSLSGFVEPDSFFYYDPVSLDTLRFENDFEIEWSSDDPDLFIPNKNNKDAMELNTTYIPPIEDTWFILTATDSLGMTEVDSVFFDSPFTEAKFSVEYWDKINKNWSTDLNSQWSKDDGSLDAPLTVKFINESVNGFEYNWILLDTTNQETGEHTIIEEFSEDESYQPEIIYYTADKYYYPYLISYGDRDLSNPPCTDTFRLEDGIRVVASELMIPNVFSPNEDGINDNFVFKHQSIKKFKITITDRTGMVVYRAKIDDIYEWEGWRGTVLNTNIPASEGQYYYIIEGMGYDNVTYKDPNYIQRKRNDRQETGGNTGQNQQGTEEGQNTQNRYIGWIYLFRGTSD